ncbi:hypothetical protein ACHQM5_000085 [Ranunculus cassubicifolius]
MADAYWRYNDVRQQQQPQQQQQPMPPIPMKRPRSDYDMPGGHDVPSYFSREDERAGYRGIPETDSIASSYDRYLRSGQISAYGSEPGRPLSGGLGGHPVDDRRVSGGVRGYEPMVPKIQNLGKPEISLPPDASNTLFVEGLPANCTRREVSHIFRPFVGFKEVRLVNKEARRSGGDPVVLCFVDFDSPAQAATAMDALQGYKFDEHDRDSANIKLQFARFPGPRTGGGGGGGDRGGRPRGGRR